MRFVSIDFETTGIVQGYPNEPWQLGGIEIVDGEVVAESTWEFYFNVSKERPFSPRAPGRWAMMRDELAAAPALMDVWQQLCDRVLGVPLVAHNAATERTVLTKRAPLTQFGPWIDTLKLTRKFWPLMSSYSLGDIIATFGLNQNVDDICPGRTWHDALYDACAGAVLLAHIMKLLKVRTYEELCMFVK